MAEDKIMAERKGTDTQPRPLKPAVPPRDNPLLRHGDVIVSRRDDAEAARKRIEAWRQSRNMPSADE